MSATLSPAVRNDVIAASAASAALDRPPAQLGAAFEDEVERALNLIGENPRTYSPTEDAPPAGEFREYFIERFQYRVIYRVTVDDARVVAVAHAARRPGRVAPQPPDRPAGDRLTCSPQSTASNC